VSDILQQFEADCTQWYAWGPRGRNACEARVRAYKELIARHGGPAVIRHQPALTKALTRIELQYARGEARDILELSVKEV
jgi:hypothetical protein